MFSGVGEKVFWALFSIFNSAAEGVATSVTSVMIAGLVPIVNYETGINILFVECPFRDCLL